MTLATWLWLECLTTRSELAKVPEILEVLVKSCGRQCRQDFAVEVVDGRSAP